MTRHFQLFLVVSLFLLWFLAFDIHPAYACSGGAPLTIQGLLSESGFVAKVSAVEIDDAGQNAILRVESYLAGEVGAEYILFIRNEPAITRYLLAGRSSGGDCLGLFQEFQPTDTFYAFLRRNNDGSYATVTTLFNAFYYTFPEANSTVEVFLEGGYENGEVFLNDYAEPGTGIDVTEQEFLEIIEQESSQIPTAPNPNLPYPLKAPVRITTENGAYILPVDGGMPIELNSTTDATRYPDIVHFWGGHCADESEWCYEISPDGLNIAAQTDEKTIMFTWEDTVEGDAVLFSTTSDTVAVWNDCELTIYTTGYPPLGQEWYEIEELNSTTLEADDCSTFHQAAAWSPDGRLLAYSDDAGIWLWDVYSPQNQPRLILKSEDDIVPIPQHFSPMGRYLNFTSGSINQHLDIVTGELLPDGIISPNDRILLRYDTRAENSEFDVCSLVSFNCMNTNPLGIRFFDDEDNMGRYYDLSLIDAVMWRDDATVMVRACTFDDYDRCAIFLLIPDYFGWNNTLVGVGYDFDYDPDNHATAIVEDAHTIRINRTVIDTSQWLDDEILNIEWMPSLFYRD
jgi:hypothetical protein